MMESHDETPLIWENDIIIMSSREQVAKKQALVTGRDASWGLYSQFWSKARKPHSERIANFTEMELAELRRQYTDAHLKGIYIE